MPIRPQVWLISTDSELLGMIRHGQPPEVDLRVLTVDELNASAPNSAGQMWIDLDELSGQLPRIASRPVYFCSSTAETRPDLAPGLWVRKPFTQDLVSVLWARVSEAAEPVTEFNRFESPSAIPGWCLRFHELDFHALCRALIADLPACLHGVGAALYLREPGNDALTLAGASFQSAVPLILNEELVDRCELPPARRTPASSTPAEAARTPPDPDGTHRLAAADILGLPLTCADTEVGRIYIGGITPGGALGSPHELAVVGEFLGRCLQHAQRFSAARAEARVDSLTQLYNRLWANETLESEIHRAERHGSSLALLMLDLDGLKTVNDTFGHAAGDSALRHVANRVRTVLRQSDVAARVGGDEFLILLPETSLDGAQEVARRILLSIRDDAPRYQGAPLIISCSIGVAEWRTGMSPANLLEQADTVMYQAKKSGRNCIAAHAIGDSPAPKTAVIADVIPRHHSHADAPRVPIAGT